MHLLRAQTDHHLEVVCGDRDLEVHHRLRALSPTSPHARTASKSRIVPRSPTHGGSKSCVARPTTPRQTWFTSTACSAFRFALHPLRAARTLGIRVVLAPRGMLGAGALAIKPIKKKVLVAARLLGLFRGVRWHASTEVEAGDVRRGLPGSEIHCASNVPLFVANVLPISAGANLELGWPWVAFTPSRTSTSRSRPCRTST